MFIEKLLEIIKRLESSNLQYVQDYEKLLKESCNLSLELNKLWHENLKLKTQRDLERAELIELRKIKPNRLNFIDLSESGGE